MTNEVAIKVDGVSKSFKLPHEKHSSIKGAIIHLGRSKKGYEVQHVLKNVSLEIKKGEFFGIVGRNGSGKSTLLKLLAGIYTPDRGSITINGKLTPFIELGVGFNPELSGRENVFLNGALLGFNRKEMLAMYDEIVEFAELERFMDQKLKNYSSGMQVRLAFSVAIRVNTDILVLDEVLAVGDAAFQQKCFDYFARLKQKEKTVILVSHSMSSIEKFCTRALMIEEGKVVRVADSSSIATLYENLFLQTIPHDKDKPKKLDLSKSQAINVTAALVDDNGVIKNKIKSGSDIKIKASADLKQNIESLNIGINIRNAEGTIVYSSDMQRFEKVKPLQKGGRIICTFSIKNYFTNGEYTIDVAAVNENGGGQKLLLRAKAISSFEIMGVRHHAHSLFHPPTEVIVDYV